MVSTVKEYSKTTGLVNTCDMRQWWKEIMESLWHDEAVHETVVEGDHGKLVTWWSCAWDSGGRRSWEAVHETVVEGDHGKLVTWWSCAWDSGGRRSWEAVHETVVEGDHGKLVTWWSCAWDSGGRRSWKTCDMMKLCMRQWWKEIVGSLCHDEAVHETVVEGDHGKLVTWWSCAWDSGGRRSWEACDMMKLCMRQWWKEIMENLWHDEAVHETVVEGDHGKLVTWWSCAGDSGGRRSWKACDMMKLCMRQWWKEIMESLWHDEAVHETVVEGDHGKLVTWWSCAGDSGGRRSWKACDMMKLCMRQWWKEIMGSLWHDEAVHETVVEGDHGKLVTWWSCAWDSGGRRSWEAVHETVVEGDHGKLVTWWSCAWDSGGRRSWKACDMMKLCRRQWWKEIMESLWHDEAVHETVVEGDHGKLVTWWSCAGDSGGRRSWKACDMMKLCRRQWWKEIMESLWHDEAVHETVVEGDHGKLVTWWSCAWDSGGRRSWKACDMMKLCRRQWWKEIMESLWHDEAVHETVVEGDHGKLCMRQWWKEIMESLWHDEAVHETVVEGDHGKLCMRQWWKEIMESLWHDEAVQETVVEGDHGKLVTWWSCAWDSGGRRSWKACDMMKLCMRQWWKEIMESLWHDEAVQETVVEGDHGKLVTWWSCAWDSGGRRSWKACDMMKLCMRQWWKEIMESLWSSRMRVTGISWQDGYCAKRNHIK